MCGPRKVSVSTERLGVATVCRVSEERDWWEGDPTPRQGQRGHKTWQRRLSSAMAGGLSDKLPSLPTLQVQEQKPGTLKDEMMPRPRTITAKPPRGWVDALATMLNTDRRCDHQRSSACSHAHGAHPALIPWQSLWQCLRAVLPDYSCHQWHRRQGRSTFRLCPWPCAPPRIAPA